MPVTFSKAVANPAEPQGRVAVRLRELIACSDIRSSNQLKQRTNYAGSTLSEAMGGRKRQNRSVIDRIVHACVSDGAEADAEVEALVAILETSQEEDRDPPAVSPAERRRDRHWWTEAAQGDLDREEILEREIERDLTRSEPLQEDTLEWEATPPERSVSRPVDLSRGREQRDGPSRQVRSRIGFVRLPWMVSRVATVLVVLLLVALAGAGVSIYQVLNPMCGPNVDRVGTQCIGISDGTVNVANDPAYTTVLDKINKENNRVLTDPDRMPVVSVAYIAPFPSAHEQASGQLLRHLMGAYEVQLQRNEAGGSTALGGPPRVQLLIGNIGDDGDYWPTVVDQLRDRADPSNQAPLVAVIGLDRSLTAVGDAVAALGRAGIPMVSTGQVVDGISSDPVRDGFYSVAPAVRDQLAAAARYLNAQARRPLLVEDTSTTDLYGRNIAAQFEEQFVATSRGTPLPAPVPFDSSRPGLQTAFANALTAICQLQPDSVFFAGRGADLPDFIRVLGTRICPQVPVTVITLSDGRALAGALQAEIANPTLQPQLRPAMLANVRVVVTAQAHPAVWVDQPQLVPPAAYAELTGAFATAFPQQFPNQRIDDGGDVIMGHDAMQVVVEAIARSRPAQSIDPVTAGLVRQAMYSITTYDPVFGASGPIYYNVAGSPVAKNIPITEITPDGQILLLRAATP